MTEETFFEGKTVLVTGGAGAIGGNLVRRLSDLDAEKVVKLYRPYQVTKMLGELYTNYFCNLYGFPIVNARFFNSYGLGEVPGKYRNVIPDFFYWSMKGLPLPIAGTGEETRDLPETLDIGSRFKHACRGCSRKNPRILPIMLSRENNWRNPFGD